jgi:iron complex outermembrane receptor protein
MMARSGGRFFGVQARGWLLCTSALLTVHAVSPALAEEQTGVASVAEARRTFATATQVFDIPAGELGPALQLWARTASLKLLVPTDLIKGLRTQAVSGTFTPEAALKELLKQTRLHYRLTGARSIAIYDPRPASEARAQASTELPRITVEGQRDRKAIDPQRTLGDPPPPYAGGQVATGGRLGLLGNRSVMDTPFNQTSYTAKTIQDQQARTIGDVVQNDPSVRLVSNAGNNLDVYHIRGFYYDSCDLALNGLYGIPPCYSTSANFVERVEVLKGPSALLNGMPPAGAVGGSINLITKQAPDFPITQLTATYQSKSMFGAQVDVARRFGEHKEFGVRFNGGYRGGRTAYDNQTDDFGNAVLNMDYRGERVRFSADLGYQADNLTAPQRFLFIAAPAVPQPPPAGSTYGMPPWSYWKPKDKFAMVQGEVDITESITAYAALGWHHSAIDFLYISPVVVNTAGDWTQRPVSGPSTFDTRAGQTGVRATVDTGPINHALDVNYSQVNQQNDFSFHRGPSLVVSNLYNPLVLPLPTLPLPLLLSNTTDTKLSSIGVADTVSILDKRIQVTVGARRQTVETSTINLLTNTITSSYDESTWSPAYAVVVKPLNNVSLYANYIEGLQAGTVVGADFVNAGASFPPYRTKQKEAGVKVDFGRVTTTVAAFEITRPSLITTSTPSGNRQAPDGEQRNRGIEINTFGELTPGLRILGGVAFIDGRLTKTENGTNDGHKAQGVADVNLNMGAEWDTPFIPGLTVNGRVIYTSSQFVNAANTLSIPEWTRFDVGTRYTFASPWNGKPVTVRFAVENVLNKSYWNASYTADGVVTVGAPRTYLASTTFNF